MDISKRLIENLDRLKSFSIVARLGSISRAADLVHISQSALSHSMTKLEGDLGIRLFIRKPHGLALTPEGKALLQFSERMIVDIENFANSFASSKTSQITTLKLGTHETLAAHIWPTFIKQYYTLSKNTRFSILSGRIDNIVQMLLGGELHAILSVEPQNFPQLQVRTVYSGQLEFFASKEFLRMQQKKYKRKSLRVYDLKDVTIFTDSLACLRQGFGIPTALAEIGFKDLGQFEITSFEAAINFASMGLGVAVIPDRNARAAVNEGKVVQFKIEGLGSPSPLSYRICLVTLRNCSYQKLIDEIYAQLQSTIK